MQKTEPPVFDDEEKFLLRILQREGYGYIFRNSAGKIAITDIMPQRTDGKYTLEGCERAIVIKGPERFASLTPDDAVIDIAQYIGTDPGKLKMPDLMEKNPYKYRVDIRNNVIKALYHWYHAYKKIPITIPLSDAERMEFEKTVLGEISV